MSRQMHIRSKAASPEESITSMQAKSKLSGIEIKQALNTRHKLLAGDENPHHAKQRNRI